MADAEHTLHPDLAGLPEFSVAEQAAQLVQLEAKERQEVLLSAKNGVALARALSSETLLYTLKEIGLPDAVGLLAMASPEQVRDMLDLDCWRKDSLDAGRLTNWLLLLNESGSGKLAEWILHADIELLVLLIQRHFEVVRKVDIEEEPDFDESKYFTFDEQYLLRFRGESEPILYLLLEQLRTLDYRRYLHALENSLFELESGLEEQAFRWRAARLEDRGYPQYEEAQALFRFLPPDSIVPPHPPPHEGGMGGAYQRSPDTLHLAAGDDAITPPDHALALLAGPTSFFSQVLASLPRRTIAQIGQELAYLTNNIVTAEARDTGEVSEIRRCVGMAHDYVNIGLSYAAKEDETVARELLQTTQIRPFFQTGWSVLQRLQQQAGLMAAQLEEDGLAEWESYLDPPFREMYAGVRRKEPLFFVGLKTPGEIVSRRFGHLSEIRQVEALLAQIPTWFRVFRRWAILPEEKAPEGVGLTALWNTAFARWVLGSALKKQLSIHPLNRVELQALYDRLPPAALEERWEAFQKFLVGSFKFSEENEKLKTQNAKLRIREARRSPLAITPQELHALGPLAAHARDKIEEVLAIDIQTAALRFVEGLLVVE